MGFPAGNYQGAGSGWILGRRQEALARESGARRKTMTTLDLIGSSPKFRALLSDVARVAPVDSAVLIEGETGTGKEVIARAIHEASPRRNQRFVALNCAAIPSALLESELFGHEKGAFTGAWAQAKGRFEMAHGGTLFLDEIGDMPLELQPKLLRALQEREFERLGSGQTVRVNVRVVAATNQDLGQLVNKKLFRADLFYRLNVIPLFLPPLRERVQCIRPLTEFFVAKFAERLNKPIDEIPDEVIEVLKGHDWPGNIRELQNFIERAVLFSPGTVLRLPLDLKPMARQQGSESDPCTLADANREHILETLNQTGWMIGGQDGAANRLGLPRTTLIYKMRKLGIDTRRSLRTLPIREFADGQCQAAASC
jgi:transcriptional regulator with GAF, ATPase, and Fis domain